MLKQHANIFLAMHTHTQAYIYIHTVRLFLSNIKGEETAEYR